MKRPSRILAIAATAAALGSLTIASGQDPLAEPTVESRLLELEERVARLSTTLEMRTEVSGPRDRVNLDTRLADIERRLQQLSIEMSTVSSRISNAVSAANQAQREAQMAQQMARDVMNRVR